MKKKKKNRIQVTSESLSQFIQITQLCERK